MFYPSKKLLLPVDYSLLHEKHEPNGWRILLVRRTSRVTARSRSRSTFVIREIRLGPIFIFLRLFSSQSSGEENVYAR
jgi:hypothetical protein